MEDKENDIEPSEQSSLRVTLYLFYESPLNPEMLLLPFDSGQNLTKNIQNF